MFFRALFSLLLFASASSIVIYNSATTGQHFAADVFLERAKIIIANQSNLTAAKNCLIKSFALYSNAEAALILGKIHLFGTKWHESTESQTPPDVCSGTTDVTHYPRYRLYLSQLTDELAINSSAPNFDRASFYFTNSLTLGNRDAGVFIYFLYQQTQILTKLNRPSPLITHHYAIQAFNNARIRGSYYAYLIYAQRILTCNRLTKKPTTELIQYNNTTELPILTSKDVFPQMAQGFADIGQLHDFSLGQCESCAAGLVYLIPILTQATQNLEKTGGIKVAPPRLDAYHKQVIKNKQDFDTDFSTGLEILKQKAQKGNVNAQVALGDSYFFGNPELGIQRNLSASEKYYRLAAEQNNNAHAQNALGVMRLQGIGVQRNVTEAMQFFTQASKNGDIGAMNSLGYAYLLGSNGKQNSTLAIEWMERAAQYNHTESEANLGSLLKAGLYGVRKDEKKALVYTTRAAKKGQVLSILNLAQFYIEKQYDQSFHMDTTCWEIMNMALEAIHKSEFVEYQFHAFQAYQNKEFETSYVAYSFGALLGFPDAIFASAYLWEKDRVDNFECKGSKSNRCALGYYYQSYLLRKEEHLTTMGNLIHEDANETDTAALTQAFKLYNYSFLLNNDPKALHSFAWMSENGIGTEKNHTNALKGYQKLVNGYLEGQYKISAFVAGLIQLVRFKISEIFVQFVN